jgi:hypothetical protein
VLIVEFDIMGRVVVNDLISWVGPQPDKMAEVIS